MDNPTSNDVFDTADKFTFVTNINMTSKTDSEDNPEKHRSKSKAGIVDEIPSALPIITNKEYQNAMSYNDDDKAYLQPLKSLENLEFTNGMLFFKTGKETIPATLASLKDVVTNETIKDFNLPLLRAFYAIFLKKFEKTWNEDRSVSNEVSIYIPDLAKQIGFPNINYADFTDKIYQDIQSFKNIMGIIDRGKRGNDILPLINFEGYFAETNTIKFSSPYMTKIIQDIFNASRRENRVKLADPDKNAGMLPSYSYIPNMKLAKEKNQRAVEIVCIVMVVIEQAGNNTPHITARNIIYRNPLLKQALEKAEDNRRRNMYLKRAFSKAWELLKTHTDILEKYKNIKLPDASDPKCIPTINTLDMVFEFPHTGKIKNG